MDMEDAVRLNACAVATQVFVGGEFETQSVINLTNLIDMGNRVGVPVLGVTAVGKRDGPRHQICSIFGHPDMRRARRRVRQDLFRARFRNGHRRLSRCPSSLPAARNCPSSTR